MENRPKGWIILLLFLGAILCLPGGIRTPVETYWQMFLVVSGTCCLLIALALSGLYMFANVVDTLDQVHNYTTRTVRVREVEAIRLLTSEQLRLVPPYPYGAEIVAEIHQNGSRLPIRWFKLWTPWGLVPYEWCHEFLVKCSITHLVAVRDYRNKPKDFQYARWFTDWCKMNLLATGGSEGEGPNPAEWVDAYAKQRALKMLGFEPIEMTPEFIPDAEGEQKMTNRPRVKNKRRDYSTILLWSAALVTVVRYASAFIASDIGQITGKLSEAVTIAMGVTGLGMGLLDTLGSAYLFDGWRRIMPKSGQKWPARFKVLTVFIALLFTTGICILVPYTVSRVAHKTMEEVLYTPALLWGWSLMVNLAPFLLIGSVSVSTVGLVSVNQTESTVVTGKLPENYPVIRSEQLATRWDRVPGSEYHFIATATTEAICDRYGVTDRTARNWRTWAQQALSQYQDKSL